MARFILVLEVEATDGQAAWDFSDKLEDDYPRHPQHESWIEQGLGVFEAQGFSMNGVDIPAG